MKLQSDMVGELIFQLDKAQKQRTLTAEELALRKLAKSASWVSQQSVALKSGNGYDMDQSEDANSKYFHLRANARQCKNFIPALIDQDRTVTAHQDKAEVLCWHCQGIFSTQTSRVSILNWESLDIQRHDLAHLDRPISEEVCKAVFELPSEKAARLDGYTGLFYMLCWSVVKDDLMQAMHQLYILRGYVGAY
jgi:hypothetical protein